MVVEGRSFPVTHTPSGARYSFDASRLVECNGGKTSQVFQSDNSNHQEQLRVPGCFSAQDNEVHLVPWSDPVFGSIDFEAYVSDRWHEDETFMTKRLVDLQKFGKPVNLSEFGCRSAKGAAYDAGGDIDPTKPLDEDEQGNYIVSTSTC